MKATGRDTPVRHMDVQSVTYDFALELKDSLGLALVVIIGAPVITHTFLKLTSATSSYLARKLD